MAAQGRTTLKSYFETGDKPTESQFADLIDSSLNLVDDANIKTSSLIIPSAEVLQLFTTPKILVPDPGVGKVIIPLSITFFMVFNSVPYDTNTSLTIYHDTLPIDIMFSTGFIEALENFNALFHFQKTIPPSTKQLSSNKALMIGERNGNPLNGNSDITIITLYQIIG